MEGIYIGIFFMLLARSDRDLIGPQYVYIILYLNHKRQSFGAHLNVVQLQVQASQNIPVCIFSEFFNRRGFAYLPRSITFTRLQVGQLMSGEKGRVKSTLLNGNRREKLRELGAKSRARARLMSLVECREKSTPLTCL